MPDSCRHPRENLLAWAAFDRAIISPQCRANKVPNERLESRSRSKCARLLKGLCLHGCQPASLTSCIEPPWPPFGLLVVVSLITGMPIFQVRSSQLHRSLARTLQTVIIWPIWDQAVGGRRTPPTSAISQIAAAAAAASDLRKATSIAIRSSLWHQACCLRWADSAAWYSLLWRVAPVVDRCPADPGGAGLR